MPFDISSVSQAALALGMLLVGFMNCFFGFNLIRMALGLWGVAAGVFVGLYLLPPDAATPTAILIVAVIGGLAGGVAFVMLYLAGAFGIGLAVGYVLALIVMNGLGMSPNLILGGIVAIIFGVVALIMNRLFLVLATAVSGASGMALGITMIFTEDYSLVNLQGGEVLVNVDRAMPAIFWVSWVVLALVGFFVQYRATAKDRD